MVENGEHTWGRSSGWKRMTCVMDRVMIWVSLQMGTTLPAVEKNAENVRFLER